MEDVYIEDGHLASSDHLRVFDLQEGTRELAGTPEDVPMLSRDPFWMVPVVP